MRFDHDAKTVTFRQSWIDTAGTCPEQARLGIVAPEWDELDSDEAFIGTAAHFGIESFIRGEGNPAEIAHTFALQKDPETIRWTKRSSLDEIAIIAAGCADEWLKNIWPYVPRGGHTEVTFKVSLFEHRGYAVILTGTADYVLPNEIWDWKTAGDPERYKPWKKQRWAVQPTAYLAVAAMGLMPHAPAFALPAKFRYGVAYKPKGNKGYSSDIITVTRSQADFDWLFRRIRTYVDMGLTALDVSWPMIDEENHLCSSKWCPWWSTCKGAHVVDNYATPNQAVVRVKDHDPQRADLNSQPQLAEGSQ